MHYLNKSKMSNNRYNQKEKEETIESEIDEYSDIENNNMIFSESLSFSNTSDNSEDLEEDEEESDGSLSETSTSETENDSTTDKSYRKQDVKKSSKLNRDADKESNFALEDHMSEVQMINKYSILEEDEKTFLDQVNYKHFIVDSLLLQKLANLSDNLSHQLIYSLLFSKVNTINTNNNYQLVTNNNNNNNSKNKNNKSEKNKNEEIAIKIYDLLFNRLTMYKNRIPDMLCYMLLQLNEKSGLTISQNNILMMSNRKLRKPKKIKSDKKIINNKKILLEIKQKQDKAKLIKRKEQTYKHSKLKKKIVEERGEEEEEEPSDYDDDYFRLKTTNSKQQDEYEIMDQMHRPASPMKDDEYKVLKDFTEFLNAHGPNGVKTLSKLISNNICNTLSTVVEQNRELNLDNNPPINGLPRMR